MRLNVMVVDDETPICEWLVYCIQKSSPDYEVSSAANGEEAYARILERKPDLVFTDIRMPGMDGLELMRRVLEVLPFTVFAILTNYAEFTYAKQAVSLGAREYFLKSELRAADIQKLLSSVEASKQRITSAKTRDVLPSGCIDLFNFYRDQEQPYGADRFWEKQGMERDIPYALLCVPNGRRQAEWHRLVSLAEELKGKFRGIVYTAVASEKEYEYLVLQTEEEGVEGGIRWLTDRLLENSGVGTSRTHHARSEITNALREAACALDAQFFLEERALVRYEALVARPAINRQNLQEEKRKLLLLLDQHHFTEAMAEMERWFFTLKSPSAEDVDWAVDSCRRMVLAVEERYYQEAGSSTQQILEVQTSLAQCVRRCTELLSWMKSYYSERCSPSIVRALEYIHEHYQDGISMAEVARQVYRSPEYFSRQFKEEVGENFSVYLTLYRLDRAQELLQCTDLRVNDIAERVGYSTPGYFSRLYKKYKGIPPEEERKSKTRQKSQNRTSFL